jgi:hypothetical protein
LPVVVASVRLEVLVDRIVRRGGLVTSRTGMFSDEAPVLWRLPEWLRDHAVLRKAYGVYFSEPRPGHPNSTTLTRWPEKFGNATNDDLALVRDLGRVEELSLAGAYVDDEGLQHVAALRRLTWLELTRTRVTGPGLAHLRDLPLKLLNLDDTAVDDAGLAFLERLPDLTFLFLARTRVRGPGLVHLAGLRALAMLDLDETPIDDDGLRYLVGTSVIDLSLASTAVSDAGLVHLFRMPRLARVDLSCSRVTAEGSKRLIAMKHIRVENWTGGCP